MKMTFLGTSATWPLPRKGQVCHCPICQSKDKRDKRLRSAILVSGVRCQVSGNILIDAGPDIVKELKREKVKKIDAVIITHAHSDHIAGLKGLQIDKSVPIYALNQVHQRIKANFSQKVEYKKKVIKPYQGFRISPTMNVGVPTASVGKDLPALRSPCLVGRQADEGGGFMVLPVEHSKNFPTVAVKVTSDKRQVTRSLIYTPDYKEIPEKSKKLIKNADVLILGGAILTRKIPWHKPITEGIKLAQELKAKKVYFTHIGHKTLPHKELEEFVQREGGKQFGIAYDGMEVNLK